MKGTLWCKIFGHVFKTPVAHGEAIQNPLGFEQRARIWEWSERCWRCGLSKEELGIDSLPAQLKQDLNISSKE